MRLGWLQNHFMFGSFWLFFYVKQVSIYFSCSSVLPWSSWNVLPTMKLDLTSDQHLSEETMTDFSFLSELFLSVFLSSFLWSTLLPKFSHFCLSPVVGRQSCVNRFPRRLKDHLVKIGCMHTTWMYEIKTEGTKTPPPNHHSSSGSCVDDPANRQEKVWTDHHFTWRLPVWFWDLVRVVCRQGLYHLSPVSAFFHVGSSDRHAGPFLTCS